jgi:hypothetical protein
MLPPDEVAPPRHAEAHDGHLVGRDPVGWAVQELLDLAPSPSAAVAADRRRQMAAASGEARGSLLLLAMERRVRRQ